MGVIGAAIVSYYTLNGEARLAEETSKCKVTTEDVGSARLAAESALTYEDTKIYIGNHE